MNQIITLALCLFAVQSYAENLVRSKADLYYFTPEEAATAKEDFKFSPLKTPTKGLVFDSDVPANIQTQIRNDLEFVTGIQGGVGTPLHQKIFGAVAGETYKHFFESHIKRIGMDDCGNSNAVACVIPFRNSSKMWLTHNFVDFSHPQIARLMLIFHEARHSETENGNWSHATCPEPFLNADGKDMKSIWTGALLASEPACDSTPFGSYGSSSIMLKNIQKFCTNCTDKVKLDAGLYADNQLGRITDPGAERQMRQDFEKLQTLEEILGSKNDNDPRLDRDFNALSTEARTLFRKKYREIPVEQRNQRGTVVYLLGKNAFSRQDWAFLREVVGEPASMRTSDEVTAAYPSLVALKLAQRALKQGRFIQEAKSVLKIGKNSKIPVISRLAASMMGD